MARKNKRARSNYLRKDYRKGGRVQLQAGGVGNYGYGSSLSPRQIRITERRIKGFQDLLNDPNLSSYSRERYQSEINKAQTQLGQTPTVWESQETSQAPTQTSLRPGPGPSGPGQQDVPDNTDVITGETTGVKGKVLGYSPATTSSPPYLYGDILKAGGNGETIKFDNGENLSVNIATQHTTSYSADVASLRAAVEADPAFSVVQKGSAVTVEEGVYFIRGQFVRCQ